MSDGADVAHGATSLVRGPRKLKVLCVGAGRDGTQSLNHLIEYVFAASGDHRSMHEYGCREFSQAFCDLAENGDGNASGTLERMVADCPYDCIVSHGYAAILPLFAKHYGRDLKVVHLCRADRDACIASLIKNADLFPTAYRYYSSSPEATVKRMAAFHFGEMSRAAWDGLSLIEKFAWYYDKTHALIRQHLALFDASMVVETESLNDPAIRRSIAEFVDGPAAVLAPKTHLNAAAIDIGSVAKEHRIKMNWLMGRLNIAELATDDVYALEYFLNKFIAWTGYQISAAPELDGTPPPPAVTIAANLERAAKILKDGLRDVEGLSKAQGIPLKERDFSTLPPLDAGGFVSVDDPTTAANRDACRQEREAAVLAREHQAALREERAQEREGAVLAREHEAALREERAQERESVVLVREHEAALRKERTQEREDAVLARERQAALREERIQERESAVLAREHRAALREERVQEREGVVLAREREAALREERAQERENAVLAREHQAALREERVQEREGVVLAREHEAALREESTQEREGAVLAREHEAALREERTQEREGAVFAREQQVALREERPLRAYRFIRNLLKSLVHIS